MQASIDFATMMTAESRGEHALALARAAARLEIAQHMSELMEQITGAVPLFEMLSWGTKALAARAVLSGFASEADRMTIETEAAVMGEAAQTLAARIVARADEYQNTIARMTGERRRIDAAISAASSAATVAQVMAGARSALQRGVSNGEG